VVFITPITDEAIPVNWDQAEEAGLRCRAARLDLPAGATFDDLPGAATKPKNYGDWQKAFVTWLSHVAGPDDVSEPVAGCDVERERVGRRLPRTADAEGAREARRGRGGAASEVRAEARGCCRSGFAARSSQSKKEKAQASAAMGSERPADWRDSAGCVPRAGRR
jgi:hypothetical protein